MANLKGNYSDSVVFSEDKNFVVLLPQANKALLDSEVRELGESLLSQVRRSNLSTFGSVATSEGDAFKVSLTGPTSTDFRIKVGVDKPSSLYLNGFLVLLRDPTGYITYGQQNNPSEGLFPGLNALQAASGTCYNVVYLDLKFREVLPTDAAAEITTDGTWFDPSILDAQLGYGSSNRLKAVVDLRATGNITESYSPLLSDPFAQPQISFATANEGGNPFNLDSRYSTPIAIIKRSVTGTGLVTEVIDLLSIFNKRVPTITDIKDLVSNGGVTQESLVRKALSVGRIADVTVAPNGSIGVQTTYRDADRVWMDDKYRNRAGYNYNGTFISPSALPNPNGLRANAYQTASVTPRAVNPSMSYVLGSVVANGVKGSYQGYQAGQYAIPADFANPTVGGAPNPDVGLGDWVASGSLIFPKAHFISRTFIGPLGAPQSVAGNDYALFRWSGEDALIHSRDFVNVGGDWPSVAGTEINSSFFLQTSAQLSSWSSAFFSTANSTHSIFGVNSKYKNLFGPEFKSESLVVSGRSKFFETVTASARSAYSYSGTQAIRDKLIIGQTDCGNVTPAIPAGLYLTTNQTYTTGPISVLRLDPLSASTLNPTPMVYGSAFEWDSSVSAEGVKQVAKSSSRPMGTLNFELRSGLLTARAIETLGGPLSVGPTESPATSSWYGSLPIESSYKATLFFEPAQAGDIRAGFSTAPIVLGRTYHKRVLSIEGMSNEQSVAAPTTRGTNETFLRVGSSGEGVGSIYATSVKGSNVNSSGYVKAPYLLVGPVTAEAFDAGASSTYNHIYGAPNHVTQRSYLGLTYISNIAGPLSGTSLAVYDGTIPDDYGVSSVNTVAIKRGGGYANLAANFISARTFVSASELIDSGSKATASIIAIPMSAGKSDFRASSAGITLNRDLEIELSKFGDRYADTAKPFELFSLRSSSAFVRPGEITEANGAFRVNDVAGVDASAIMEFRSFAGSKLTGETNTPVLKLTAGSFSLGLETDSNFTPRSVNTAMVAYDNTLSERMEPLVVISAVASPAVSQFSDLPDTGAVRVPVMSGWGVINHFNDARARNLSVDPFNGIRFDGFDRTTMASDESRVDSPRIRYLIDGPLGSNLLGFTFSGTAAGGFADGSSGVLSPVSAERTNLRSTWAIGQFDSGTKFTAGLSLTRAPRGSTQFTGRAYQDLYVYSGKKLLNWVAPPASTPSSFSDSRFLYPVSKMMSDSTVLHAAKISDVELQRTKELAIDTTGNVGPHNYGVTFKSGNAGVPPYVGLGRLTLYSYAGNTSVYNPTTDTFIGGVPGALGSLTLGNLDVRGSLTLASPLILSGEYAKPEPDGDALGEITPRETFIIPVDDTNSTGTGSDTLGLSAAPAFGGWVNYTSTQVSNGVILNISLDNLDTAKYGGGGASFGANQFDNWMTVLINRGRITILDYELAAGAPEYVAENFALEYKSHNAGALNYSDYYMDFANPDGQLIEGNDLDWVVAAYRADRQYAIGFQLTKDSGGQMHLNVYAHYDSEGYYLKTDIKFSGLGYK